MSRPVAAIDCGTNTIKLLVTGPDGELVREMRMVRLGEGVDRTGMLAPAALERTFAALDEYADLLREHDVPASRVRFCATSASRDAGNADVFRAGVRARLGLEVPRNRYGTPAPTITDGVDPESVHHDSTDLIGSARS